MPPRSAAIAAVLLATVPLHAADAKLAAEFENEIRPVLVSYCNECHKAGQEVPFLSARTLAEVQSQRGRWRSVAAQLRNHTMPPLDEEQPELKDRARAADWLQRALRETARDLPDYAGHVVTRRLNRLEYDSTIRDLIGLELNFSETFPTDGGGGEGFDNNGETLFLPPLLMERYIDAAGSILDAAIVSPPLVRRFAPTEFVAPDGPPLTAGTLPAARDASVSLPVLVTGSYTVRIALSPVGPPLVGAPSSADPQARPADERQPYNRAAPIEVALRVDGIVAHRFTAAAGAETATETVVRLPRGQHTLSLRPTGGAAVLASFEVTEKSSAPTAAKLAAHARLFGPDAQPLSLSISPSLRRARAAAILGDFTRRAFRRPLAAGELDRLLSLYDRSAARAEPFEEGVKLALRAVLVSPHFLFRAEADPTEPGVFPVSNHELASRLSYFLWASMPDAELSRLADAGTLRDPAVLTAQAARLLADPRARVFLDDFTGQWLGTKEVGASVAFTGTAFKGIYTVALSDDLRAEPLQVMRYLVDENRSLLELLDADYIWVTQRLAQHYGLPATEGFEDKKFRRVAVTDGRRGGVMGLGAVAMVTSHPDRTSPVLRGAWVLEKLLGTPIPPPPPDIPPLSVVTKKNKNATPREQLALHRDSLACRSCHQVMDPIGFGLENYDVLGRWRDTDKGQPIDAAATTPDGEAFNGPAELKKLLLTRKADFTRHFTAKMLGYALGRSLDDRDDRAIENIVAAVEADGYRLQTLIREIVLSAPFRHREAPDPKTPAVMLPVAPAKKKLIPAAVPK